MKPKVIIEVSSGCVREISSDIDVDVMIVDYDIQGFDEDVLIEIPSTGDLASCVILEPIVNAKKVRNLYTTIKRDLSL